MRSIHSLVVLLVAGLGALPAGLAVATEAACPAPVRQALQAIVDARMRTYDALYPDIQFVQLDAPDEAQFRASAEMLSMLLGYQATNLDYEHPPEVRDDLLYVSIKKLLMFLQQSESVASLFRVGVNSLSEREQLCVVVMDPCRVAADDATASRYLIDFSDALFARLPAERYLPREDVLRFALDHEVFHCLDSHLNEPVPRSKKEYWAPYMHHYHELGADAYATAMHIVRKGGADPHAETLMHQRGLSLLMADPDHFTPEAMQRVLDDAPTLTGKSPHELFEYATALRSAMGLDYARYLDYRHAAEHAMDRLGLERAASFFGDTGAFHDEPADSRWLQALLERTRASVAALFGDALQAPE